MEVAKKITIQIDPTLLSKAQDATGKGITRTVREGLELIAAGPAYDSLRQLKGKVRFSMNLDKLREDR